jgi:hypothetical protein
MRATLRIEALVQPTTSAQAASVAEAGLFFVLDQLVEVEAERLHGLARRTLDAEGEEVITELRPHQVLGGEVDDRAVLLFEVRARGADPPVQDPVAHRAGEREVVIVSRRDARELCDLEEELFDERLADRRGIEAEHDVVRVDVLRLAAREHAPVSVRT